MRSVIAQSFRRYRHQAFHQRVKQLAADRRSSTFGGVCQFLGFMGAAIPSDPVKDALPGHIQYSGDLNDTFAAAALRGGPENSDG